MATSIKKNFFYNAFYNILVLILPLITAPYISRVMGAEKIGIYSYAYSVSSYFGLFILLGLNNYGNRTIASVKGSKKELSKTFWNIYAMQLILGLFVCCIYFIYVIFLTENKTMAFIQIIYLISVIMDINWFFFGIENFKLTVTRNTLIKILSVFCMFVFVRDSEDIYIYALLMVSSPLISQIFLWFFLKKYINFVKPTFKEVRKHIVPNLVLFVPVIAISLYTIMDKVMLGAISSMREVGYYESSNKLTAIPSMVITSLGTVMLPRMSNLIANGKGEEAKRYIEKSLMVSVFLSTSMAFGLSAVSKEFVPFFYGRGFEKCTYIIPILVLSSIFISWANVIRTQYLIPNKKDKIYIVSVFVGAGVNIIINLILIPYLQSVGAAIGTVFAEFSVCAYQTYKVRKEIRVWKYLRDNLPILFCSIFMYLIVVRIPFTLNNLITIFVKIIVGVFAYFVFLVIFHILKKYYLHRSKV